MTGVPKKRGNLDTDTQREDYVGTQGEDSHRETKDRGLERVLSSPASERTNPTNTLISGFSSPE